MAEWRLVKILQKAGVWLSPLVVAGGYVLSGYGFVNDLLGFPVWSWQVIGVLIFAVCLISIVYGQSTKPAEIATEKRMRTAEMSHAPVDQPIFNTSIKTRPQWEAELPLSEIFKPGNEVHALFLTGEGIFTRSTDYARYIRRLILPVPDAQFLALAERSRKDAGHHIDLGAQIKNYVRVAKNNGVSVRCLNDHIGISLLICNPEKPEAWIHVGFSTPFIEADTQPIVRLEKKHSPELYGIFLNAYNKLWDSGHEPRTENAIQEVPIKPPTQEVEESGFTSMKEAARKLYEAARAGKIRHAQGSESLSGWSNGGPSAGSPEDILDWWAVHAMKELSVYGRRPPSAILEEIPARDVKDFVITDGASKLKDPLNDSAYYTDLRLKSDEFEAQFNFELGFHGERL